MNKYRKRTLEEQELVEKCIQASNEAHERMSRYTPEQLKELDTKVKQLINKSK